MDHTQLFEQMLGTIQVGNEIIKRAFDMHEKQKKAVTIAKKTAQELVENNFFKQADHRQLEHYLGSHEGAIKLAAYFATLLYDAQEKLKKSPLTQKKGSLGRAIPEVTNGKNNNKNEEIRESDKVFLNTY